MAVNGTARTSTAKPSPGRTTKPSPGGTYKASTPRQRQQARRAKAAGNRTRTSNRSKTREYHLHIGEKNVGGGGGGAQGEWSRKSPIGDAEFLSAGHVRAFAEKGRKAMREASVDFAYAAATLKAVLREVPAPDGQGRSGSWLRANRVARQLKRAANAAQAASAHSARTWPAFMREYAPELNTYGGPRQPARKRMNFGS